MWRSVAFALSCLAFLSHSTYAVIIRGSWVVVNVSDAVCSPLSYGGVGDGVHNDTLAVQAAIDACVTASGTAVIDSGHTFLTYALEVRNARNFAVRVDGTLRFSNDTAGWSSRYASCIAVTGSAFIAFHGSGLVDGNGAAWWPQPDGFRPGLLHVEGGNDLLIRDTTYLNSPNHNLQLYAANFEVTSTTILASPPCPEVGPSVCAHNTDGIDVHAKPAWIHHNFISVGDDNVAMHDNDTLVEDNVFGTGHGASIGSLGGAINLRNITVRRTSFNGTVQAMRIKSDPGATGILTDVLYEDIVTYDVGQTILVTMQYPKPDPTKRTTLVIRNVTFRDIVATNSHDAGAFDCDASSPCQLTLVNVTHVGTQPSAWQCTDAHGTAVGVTPAPCLIARQT